MKKLLIKKIDDCSECDHWVFPNMRDYCKKKRRFIPNDATEIPAWCPLPDEKEKPKLKLKLFNRRNK